MFYNKIDKNSRITENRKTFIFILIIIATKGEKNEKTFK